MQCTSCVHTRRHTQSALHEVHFMPCKILCTLHACGTHEVHTRSAYTKCIACVCMRTILLYNLHTSQLLAALIRIRIFNAMQIVLAECHINHILNTNQTTLWICYTTSTTHIWIMIRRQPRMEYPTWNALRATQKPEPKWTLTLLWYLICDFNKKHFNKKNWHLQ